MSLRLGRSPPCADEVFSTWIVRLARLGGLTPYAFTKLVLNSHWIWCRDTDLMLGNDELDRLASYAGLPKESLLHHTFREFGEPIKRAITPGILAFGVYHRLRKAHGVQYCPACLSEDTEAYLRREWRFALQFGCAKHGVSLIDACPHCGAPLMPHRRMDGDLRKCSECCASLLVEPTQLSESEWTASRAVQGLFTEKSMPLADDRVTLQDSIAVARYLFALITHPRTPPALISELSRTGATRGTERSRYDTLETTRHDVRRWAVPMCLALLESWPNAFLKACSDHGVTRTQVYDPRRSVPPAWFAEALLKLPHVPRTRRRRRRPRVPKPGSYTAAFQTIPFEQYFDNHLGGRRR